MALDRLLRLMVIRDGGVLKGRDPVEAGRRVVAGGAGISEWRLEDAPPRELVAPAGPPVIRVGGATGAKGPALVRAGGAGVAVIGAVWGARDPAAAGRALRDAIA